MVKDSKKSAPATRRSRPSANNGVNTPSSTRRERTSRQGSENRSPSTRREASEGPSASTSRAALVLIGRESALQTPGPSSTQQSSNQSGRLPLMFADPPYQRAYASGPFGVALPGQAINFTNPPYVLQSLPPQVFYSIVLTNDPHPAMGHREHYIGLSEGDDEAGRQAENVVELPLQALRDVHAPWPPGDGRTTVLQRHVFHDVWVVICRLEDVCYQGRW